MAGNGAIINNIYNYYLTTYAPRGTSRFDTHKKSELRNVYNSIVKLNKESPLYKLDSNKESRSFAVDIKEEARSLRNTIASLGGLEEEKMLNKKAAYSSNENIASVTVSGSFSGSDIIPSYEIEVESLASSQVNMGRFLPDSKTKLPPDVYSFDVSIHNMNYEFQFNIYGEDTNTDIMNRLARLISNSDIGLTADVAEDNKGNHALRLRSSTEGLSDLKTSIFVVSDEHTSKTTGSVDYLGINYTARPASNASFTVNGQPYISYSNEFTLGGFYDIKLNGVSDFEGSSATVGLKTDVESLTENIGTLIDSYNHFLNKISEHAPSFPGSLRLLSEMKGIADTYRSHFDLIGITPNEKGELQISEEQLKKAAFSDTAKEDFAPLKTFANSLVRKTSLISLNPMEYVDKKIIAYKNPGKNFATPYITSAYSGMLFNYYC